VQYFNHDYKRSGTLWEGRYRATVVDSERYLLTLMRYIELNPVRAGMVAMPEDYRRSSYRCNALCDSGKNSDWLRPHPKYACLGPEDAVRREAYRALFSAAIDPLDLGAIRDCTHKGWALGGERFRAEVETLVRRRAGSKGVGRPRKALVGPGGNGV